MFQMKLNFRTALEVQMLVIGATIMHELHMRHGSRGTVGPQTALS